MADFRTLRYDGYLSSYTGRSVPGGSALHPTMRGAAIATCRREMTSIATAGFATSDTAQVTCWNSRAVQVSPTSRASINPASRCRLRQAGVFQRPERLRWRTSPSTPRITTPSSPSMCWSILARTSWLISSPWPMGLADGGVFIVQTTNGSGLFPGEVACGDSTHMTVLAPESLEQLLPLGEFRDFTLTESGPVGKDLRGMLRVFGWSAIRMVASLAWKIETGKEPAIWTENLICRCRKAPSRGTT